MNPIKLIPLHPGSPETWSNGAEQHAVHLTYDVSAFLASWPDATPSVAFERADGKKYAHIWELQDTTLHIPLLLADTEAPGICKCMITLHSGDGQANTAIFYGSVMEGIDTLGETPSVPEQGIIEQVNAAAARAEAAANGGGGGSGILFVHITTEDGETYAADKTYADIRAALDAGQMVYACIMDAYYVPLIGAAEETAIFSMLASMFGQISAITALIMSDGTVTVEMT